MTPTDPKTKTRRVTLKFDRETKGAVRYTEPGLEQGDPNYLIGTLYLRKAQIGRDFFPLTITVTIEE